MSRKLYVGNLSPEVTEGDLAELFSEFGETQNITLARNEETGEPLGYAFVEMEAEQANLAKKGLNGRMLKGISIIVNNARMRRISGGKNQRPRGRRKYNW